MQGATLASLVAILYNDMKEAAVQVFILIPGTTSNLGVYVSWYRCGARQAGVFLPDHTSGASKVSVDAGDTLFIPGRVAVLLPACLCVL